jgi:2-polyprenyl-3-methyl-5-hydroxy-6-metoxy-1,4-benzoquinol methylase
MNPLEFFDLFDAELPRYDTSQKINTYYKFLRKGPLYGWRKSYFVQRLEYIYENIVKNNGSKDALVWDIGCGFGTSGLFLAMNGIRTMGLTLESYHHIIAERKKYWRQFGNAELFSYTVEDLFETAYGKETFDFILVQDTLHHIEPVSRGVSIMQQSLKSDGKLVVVDENGSNIILRAMLYKLRGNNRIIEGFDENLKRNVVMGNENVRSLKQWERIINDNGFAVSDIQYIKFLPPYVMNENNFQQLNIIEQKLWRKYPFLREGFFWGLNFVCQKQPGR